MPIYLGDSEIGKVYLGDEQICKIYLGDELIYSCAQITVDSGTANLTTKSYTFKTADFSTNFSTDNVGETIDEVILKSITTYPSLNLLGQSVSKNDSFKANNASGLKFTLSDNYAVYQGALYQFDKPISEIISDYDQLGYKLTDNSSGTLTFTNQQDNTDQVTVNGRSVSNDGLKFTFAVTDTSGNGEESNVANFSLIPQGDINVKSVYVNNPPVTGDGVVQVVRSGIYTFTTDDFTTNTNPAYYDQEGDSPWKLVVETLPPNGTLLLDNVPVTASQEILFTDIANQLLTFDPDTNRQVTTVEFDWSIIDTGAQ